MLRGNFCAGILLAFFSLQNGAFDLENLAILHHFMLFAFVRWPRKKNHHLIEWSRCQPMANQKNKSTDPD